MNKLQRCTVPLVALFCLQLPAFSQDSASSTSAPDNASVVTLGGETILRLRASAGGMTPQQRVDLITERLVRAIGVPHLTPSDIVIYLPPQTGHGNHAPVIYVLGRRLITVDAATVKAAGGGSDEKKLAIQWAKRLQQVLPRVNIRLPNDPDIVVPENPKLVITTKLEEVGGDVGVAMLHDHVVIRLHGVQSGGLTAAERADILSARLERIANTSEGKDPNSVQVVLLPMPTPAATVPPAADTKSETPPLPKTGDAVTPTPSPPAQIVIAGIPLITVEPVEAAAAHLASPELLANSWAKNIKAVLALNLQPLSMGPASPTSPVPTVPETPTAVAPSTP